MALDITQQQLDSAGLVLIVGEDGLYEWSSTRTTTEIVNMLHDIADEIEATS